jgi:hypothetical protein
MSISLLLPPFPLQYEKCVDRLRTQRVVISVPEQLPREELFDVGQRIRRDKRLRALRRHGTRPRPDGACTILPVRPPTATSLLFQASSSAVVAPPCGLIRELEVEGDD